MICVSWTKRQNHVHDRNTEAKLRFANTSEKEFRKATPNHSSKCVQNENFLCSLISGHQFISCRRLLHSFFAPDISDWLTVPSMVAVLSILSYFNCLSEDKDRPIGRKDGIFEISSETKIFFQVIEKHLSQTFSGSFQGLQENTPSTCKHRPLVRAV